MKEPIIAPAGPAPGELDEIIKLGNEVYRIPGEDEIGLIEIVRRAGFADPGLRYPVTQKIMRGVMRMSAIGVVGLMTLKEAADRRGVSIPAISQSKQLAIVTNPDASPISRRGRRFVMVDQLRELFKDFYYDEEE